jgi:hypothetical protein
VGGRALVGVGEEELGWGWHVGEVGGQTLCVAWVGWLSRNQPISVRGLVRGREGGESSTSERSRCHFAQVLPVLKFEQGAGQVQVKPPQR